MNPSRLWSALLGASLLSGCASTGMARTLDPGAFQVSVSPGWVGHWSQYNHNSVTYQPQLELRGRYGVVDRFDVGAGLSLVGFPEYYGLQAQVDTRFALVRAPSLDAGVDLTLAPSVYYVSGIEYRRHVGAELPLLCGFNVRGTQIVLGPRLTYLSTTHLLNGEFFAGASLGVAVPLAPWVRLVPEINVRVSVDNPSSRLVHAGVGILFGGYKPSTPHDEEQP